MKLWSALCMIFSVGMPKVAKSAFKTTPNSTRTIVSARSSTSGRTRRRPLQGSRQAAALIADDSLNQPCEEGIARLASRTLKNGNDVSFGIYYRWYNSHASNDSKRKSPLVVLHGGPSLPSQYLYPMIPQLDADRPVLFYDQLGCGKSDEPKDKKLYSIEESVKDLHRLLSHLNIDNLHLLGHSFGGVVALEYVRMHPHNVRSLILANAPTSMRVALDEYDRLYEEKRDKFWTTHACRTSEMPPLLQDAFQHLGKTWSGMDVVVDYVAEPLKSSQCPPTMLLRGEYDFGTKAAENWKDIVPTVERDVVLPNCAHYPHLEDGPTFGKLVSEFLNRHDLS